MVRMFLFPFPLLGPPRLAVLRYPRQRLLSDKRQSYDHSEEEEDHSWNILGILVSYVAEKCVQQSPASGWLLLASPAKNLLLLRRV